MKNESRREHASTPTLLVGNVRSLLPKIDELECVAVQNNVDVICLTETWLFDDIPDSAVSLRDFVLLRKDRPSHAGGLAAYISCTMPCKRLPECELNGVLT